jgi:hypothetical protein
MTTPAQEGHAGLSPAADRAAAGIVGGLARGIGHRAAVSWVHAGAVLAWCAHTGLLPDVEAASTTSGLRDGLKRLADAHPALAGFTDPVIVPLWGTEISDGGAAEIRDLWAAHPPDDPEGRPHGYLLGNAYQALSEESRKARALCQTPRYVTDLLLDLALAPALLERGTARGLRMIDPSCGTGHILVETLARVWGWTPPGCGCGALTTLGTDGVRAALAVVHGVDLEPYAALLARLRLWVMASAMLRAEAPAGPSVVPGDWPVRVVAADALLDRAEPLLARDDPLPGHGRYDVVIGNPPYITPKDAKAGKAVREAYPEVCGGQFSLALPFHQLMTELLRPGGWCAQLTANSFMKREFGKAFIEEYLPRFDLRWVIDTSGVYIPGHGTPTAILVHRNQPPDLATVATIRGVQGEPKSPADPSQGLVWRAIADGAYIHRAAAHVRSALKDWRPPLAPPARVRVDELLRRRPEQLGLFARP